MVRQAQPAKWQQYSLANPKGPNSPRRVFDRTGICFGVFCDPALYFASLRRDRSLESSPALSSLVSAFQNFRLQRFKKQMLNL
jgi:hypothetical protein